MSLQPSADHTPSATPSVARRSPQPPRASPSSAEVLDEWDLRLKEQAARKGLGAGTPETQFSPPPDHTTTSPFPERRDPAALRQIKEQIAYLVLQLDGASPPQRFTDDDLDGIIEGFAAQTCTQDRTRRFWNSRWAHPSDNPARYTIDKELCWSQDRRTPAGVEGSGSRPSAPVDERLFHPSSRDARPWNHPNSARPARQVNAFSTKSNSSSQPMRPHPRALDADRIAQLAKTVRLKPIRRTGSTVTPSERSAFSTGSFNSRTGSLHSWTRNKHAADF